MVIMSSWIKLDKSFSEIRNVNKRNSRTFHHNVFASVDIEDDSSQDSTDLDSCFSTKKRKLRPLENVTIDNDKISSDESSNEVDYNPDGTQLPNVTYCKVKPTLPIKTSTKLPHQSSTSRPTNTSRSRKSWLTFSKQNNNLPSKIEDSISDSEELINPVILIDESSKDSLITRPENPHQTVIETQDSITPPVEPFLAGKNTVPKKRKLRMVKGGMAERLKKCLSQAKSNVSFWHHHRSAELIEPGTLVTVEKVENTFGRTLIHTTINDEATIFSFFSRSLEFKEGDVIEVKFDIGRSYRTDTHVLHAFVDKAILIKERQIN